MFKVFGFRVSNYKGRPYYDPRHISEMIGSWSFRFLENFGVFRVFGAKRVKGLWGCLVCLGLFGIWVKGLTVFRV